MRFPARLFAPHAEGIITFGDGWIRGNKQDRSNINLPDPGFGLAKVLHVSDAKLGPLVVHNGATRVRLQSLKTQAHIWTTCYGTENLPNALSHPHFTQRRAATMASENMPDTPVDDRESEMALSPLTAFYFDSTECRSGRL